MYSIVAGGGKVGANVARSLLKMGHEVTLIEQRPQQFERLQDEFEHQVLLGDATELHVLEHFVGLGAQAGDDARVRDRDDVGDVGQRRGRDRPGSRGGDLRHRR